MNDYNGALFFVIMMTHMNSMLPIVLTIPTERPVFLKEENARLYGVVPYFFSKFVVESILVVAIPIVFISICYYMIGLNPAFDRFLFFLLSNVI